MAFKSQELPKEIKDETEEWKQGIEEAKKTGMGLASFLGSFMMPGAAGIWNKATDPSTRVAVLKGLAKDLRGIKSELIPSVVRNQYKNMHNLPEEILTSPDSIEFVPKLLSKSTGEPTIGGRHVWKPLEETSNVKLAASVGPKYVKNIPNYRIASHEITHAWTKNPKLMKKLGEGLESKLSELQEFSSIQPYEYSHIENISRQMEKFSKARETVKSNLGKKYSETEFVRDLKSSINKEWDKYVENLTNWVMK